MCDLAGSERVDSETSSAHFSELRSINLSLTNLGKVIFTLAKSKSKFVPFRDSKLTYLLKDALGGNSWTYLIGTIAPVKAYLS